MKVLELIVSFPIAIGIALILISCSPTKDTTNAKQSSFEGKIIYDLVMEDRTRTMTKEQAKMFMGNEQTYFIKDNKYKSVTNGMMKITQIYLGQDTLYNQVTGMNNLLWMNTTSNPNKLIDFNIQKDVATVAGIKCDLLTINLEGGTTKYYFNSKYYINPDNFKNHEYGFWKFCIEKTNSIPLKSITDTKDLYLEITAKKIIPMNINESEFKLPNLPRLESPEK